MADKGEKKKKKQKKEKRAKRDRHDEDSLQSAFRYSRSYVIVISRSRGKCRLSDGESFLVLELWLLA